MKRSTERILTTHAGSLPRPDDVLPMPRAKVRGEGYDQRAFEQRLPSAVNEIVSEQAKHGLDILRSTLRMRGWSGGG